ncbi:MAG: phosphoesterase [Promethearchaeota archaeon]|nr:MAG: phosphoesterase [Candidatus Lokiarchaeota archaeon]
MKILYTTDLHGSEWKYDRIFEIAKSLRVDMVINGGDMFPLKGNLLHQDNFIINFLDEHFSKFNSERIYYLTMLGNDDLQKFDEFFQTICDKYEYIYNINFKKIELNQFEFIGMNLVPDLPFALKDRARKDSYDFIFPKQFGNPTLSTSNGWKKIDDWFSYVNGLPTIEEEINNLIRPPNMEKAIYVIHTPPSELSLDVCHDGRKVGSKAIYEFLKLYQPFISLHGHIHESPEILGKWLNKIGRTISIQPGQSQYHQKYLVYVIMDLDTMSIDRKIVI